MKAEDTVRYFIINHKGTRVDLSQEFKEQAEISFKAGQDESWEKAKSFYSVKLIEESYKGGERDGMREVVRWIKGVNKSGDFYYSFDQAELEAKLKEWGI